MSKKILIINGPNLNMLGEREESVYGSRRFEDFLEELKEACFDLELSYYQSNIEGELVERIQKANGKYAGIVLNAGAYTHTSVAIRDAVAAIRTPVVEVHISNVMKREEFRHTSLLTGVCLGIIAGFGLESYVLAIDAIVAL